MRPQLMLLGIGDSCGRTTVLTNVKAFYFEDGYCVIKRLTPKGESECYYYADQIKIGVVP